MKIHKTITLDRVVEAVERRNSWKDTTVFGVG